MLGRWQLRSLPRQRGEDAPHRRKPSLGLFKMQVRSTSKKGVFLLVVTSFFEMPGSSSSTDGLRLLVKRPGLAHVKRFWLALRMSTLEICSSPRMFVSVSSRLLVFIAVASRQCPRSLEQRILSALTFRIVRISHMNHGGQCIRVGAGASGSTRWRGSLRAPSACRVVICELMSSERVLWLFVPRFSWWWRESLHGDANVHAHVPSSSIVSQR